LLVGCYSFAALPSDLFLFFRFFCDFVLQLYFLLNYGQEMERQDGSAQQAMFLLVQVAMPSKRTSKTFVPCSPFCDSTTTQNAPTKYSTRFLLSPFAASPRISTPTSVALFGSSFLFFVIAVHSFHQLLSFFLFFQKA